MRSVLTAVIVITALSVTVCLAAGRVLTDFADACDGHRERALELARSGDRDGAEEELAAIRALMKEKAVWNEALTSHDALHEVSVALRDAEACLKTGDTDDFERAIGQMRECLEHIRDEEELRLSNLL